MQMRKRYRVFSLAVVAAVAAVPVGLALTRESVPTVSISRAFSRTQPETSQTSDAVQLTVAGGLFLAIAAAIRRAR
jgi:ABC-type phosphate transport system substrate-binding protein